MSPCLAADGRLLVYPRDELKLQSAGGRGLTLIEVDAAAPLVSVAAFATALRVVGNGRGGRAKEETLKGAALAEHVGRRARKGRKVALFVKVERVVAAD